MAAPPAPSAARYFGKKTCQSSSPSPIPNTLSASTATLRSSPRNREEAERNEGRAMSLSVRADDERPGCADGRASSARADGGGSGTRSRESPRARGGGHDGGRSVDGGDR